MFVAGGILLRGWFYAVFCCPGRFPCTELRDAWKGRVGRIRYLFIGQTIKDGKARIYLGPWPSHGLSFTGVQDGGDTVGSNSAFGVLVLRLRWKRKQQSMAKVMRLG